MADCRKNAAAETVLLTVIGYGCRIKKRGGELVKRKLMALACITAAVLVWLLFPRPAVGEDFQVHVVETWDAVPHSENVTDQVDLEALQDLLRRAKRRGYRVQFAPYQLTEKSVDMIGMDSRDHWNLALNENFCVVYHSADQGGYPIIDGEELLEEVWKLLPEK